MDDFAPPTGINWNVGRTSGMVEYGGGDRGMACWFYYKDVPNPAKSAEKGRPVHENRIYVRIAPPGERLNVVEREATEQDKQRFPLQWEQFRRRKTQQPEGMPIELLYPDNPATAGTLRAHGIQTVEQCAELSGHAIENIGMGAQTWVNYAKRVLSQSERQAGETRMRRELDQRDREIKMLKGNVKQLQSQIDQLIQRQQGNSTPDLAQVQTLLAGLMNRPQFPPQVKFDSDTAMINAKSAERAGGKRQRPRSRG